MDIKKFLNGRARGAGRGRVDFFSHTLSGRIGKVVGSHAAVARSILAKVALIYAMHEALRGYCP